MGSSSLTLSLSPSLFIQDRSFTRLQMLISTHLQEVKVQFIMRTQNTPFSVNVGCD